MQDILDRSFMYTQLETPKSNGLLPTK